MSVRAPFEFDTACLFAGFIDDTPCFATVDGLLHLPTWSNNVEIGQDGLTAVSIANNGKCLLAGDENGSVYRFSLPSSEEEWDTAPKLQLLAQSGGQWIDYLAISPQNDAFAFSCGRKLYFSKMSKQTQVEPDKIKKFPLRQWQLDRSVEGLAFGPRGLRLGIARYNGVTLYWPDTESDPVKLEWKGAHTGVIFSPDARYIITTMQENALHGWRLKDCQHLRMSGYPTKVKSTSWSAKGRYLATSGASAAILWPFTTKDGPMNKAPLELGTRGDSMAVCVSCHPSEDMIAIGYNDGMILLASFDGQQEIPLRRGGNGAIHSMNWDKKGQRLVFGAETGEAGLIDISE